jgi:hypothetical protein
MNVKRNFLISMLLAVFDGKPHSISALILIYSFDRSQVHIVASALPLCRSMVICTSLFKPSDASRSACPVLLHEFGFSDHDVGAAFVHVHAGVAERCQILPQFASSPRAVLTRLDFATVTAARFASAGFFAPAPRSLRSRASPSRGPPVAPAISSRIEAAWNFFVPWCRRNPLLPVRHWPCRSCHWCSCHIDSNAVE